MSGFGAFLTLSIFLAVTVFLLFGEFIVGAVRPPSEAAELVVRLLKEDPGGWTADRYVAYHKDSGVGVWIASKAFGVQWWVGPRDWRESGCRKTPAADRRYIWKHVRKIARGPAEFDVDALREAVGSALMRAESKVSK